MVPAQSRCEQIGWLTQVIEPEAAILYVNPKNLIFVQTKSDLTWSQVHKLAKLMRKGGYDPAFPVLGIRRWDGRILISDGHHRVAAAILAKLDKVPVELP